MRRHLFLLLVFTATLLYSQKKHTITVTHKKGVSIFPVEKEHINPELKKDAVITIHPFGINKYPKKKYDFGSTVKFKITHVNVFKLTGTIEGKGETQTFEIPSVFKNESDLENIANNNNETPKIMAPVDISSELEETFILSKQLFTNQLQKINNYLSLENYLNTQLKDSIFIRDTLSLKTTSKNLYAATFYSSSKNTLNEVTATIDTLLTSYSFMKFSYDSINKTLNKEKFDLKGQLKDDARKTTLNVTEATVSIDRKKLFEEEMAFANKIRDSIAKPETQSLIKEKAIAGASLYNKIENETFEVYTDAFQLNDDIVTLTPKLTDAKGKVVYEFEAIKLKTKCKWKVNFSTGYLLSFIGNDNYTYRKDSTGIVGVKPSNTNKITHALGGMFHAYPNLWDGFQPAISSGLSVDTNGTLGFYFGGSLLFTEKNRLALSMGYSLTSVQRLDQGNLNSVLNQNTMTNQLDFSNTQDLEIRYNDVYRGAFFIGVTYNLSE